MKKSFLLLVAGWFGRVGPGVKMGDWERRAVESQKVGRKMDG